MIQATFRSIDTNIYLYMKIINQQVSKSYFHLVIIDDIKESLRT